MKNWLYRCLAGALALTGGVAVVVYAVSESRLQRKFSIDSGPIELVDSPVARERGRHLVTTVSQCTVCHGDDLAGAELVDDPWFGRLWAPNLTRGRGGTGDFTTADWVRSIRHGVKRDGTSVVMMPAQHLRHLSDADLAAIVSYLRALEPIDRESPDTQMGPFTRVVVAFGLAPDLLPASMVADTAPALAPAVARETADYGAYLVEAAGCKVCHNAKLTGGLHPLALPEEPEPPNLTRSGRIAGWTRADFVRAIRTGVTRDGRALDPNFMPWPAYSQMSDLELSAIWRFLETLPSHGA